MSLIAFPPRLSCRDFSVGDCSAMTCGRRFRPSTHRAGRVGRRWATASCHGRSASWRRRTWAGQAASDGPAQGEHLRDKQVDHEFLQAVSVLRRSQHVVGGPCRGPAAAAGAFLRPSLDAAPDDLEHDTGLNAAFPADRVDAGQVGAAGVAGVDRFRFLADDLPDAAVLPRGGPPPPAAWRPVPFRRDSGMPELRPVLRFALSGRTATGISGSVNRRSTTAPISPPAPLLPRQSGPDGVNRRSTTAPISPGALSCERRAAPGTLRPRLPRAAKRRSRQAWMLLSPGSDTGHLQGAGRLC